MNHEDIKQSWQMLNLRVDALEEQTRSMARELMRRKSQTIQQKLSRRYRTQALFGFLLPFLAPLLVYLELPLWLAVFYGVTGVVLGMVNLKFSFYISGHDYMALPTIDAMAHAIKVIKWQTRIQLAGYFLVALVGFPLFYEIWRQNDSAALVGAIIGGVTGLIFGIRKYKSNVRIAKELVRSFENDMQE